MYVSQGMIFLHLRPFFTADERAFHVHAYKIRSFGFCSFLYSAVFLRYLPVLLPEVSSLLDAIVVNHRSLIFCNIFNSLFTVITEVISHTPVEMQIDQSGIAYALSVNDFFPAYPVRFLSCKAFDLVIVNNNAACCKFFVFCIDNYIFDLSFYISPFYFSNIPLNILKTCASLLLLPVHAVYYHAEFFFIFILFK